MTSVEEIEEKIKDFLLREITFTLDDKKIKTGKFILFSVRDFFCIFTLQDLIKNKKVIYEIPYPFSIEVKNRKLIFDYTINTFCENNKDVYNICQKMENKKTSKLFNKKLVVDAQM